MGREPVLKLGGARGGDACRKFGGLHLVTTQVVPVGSGADKKVNFSLFP